MSVLACTRRIDELVSLAVIAVILTSAIGEGSLGTPIVQIINIAIGIPIGVGQRGQIS